MAPHTDPPDLEVAETARLSKFLELDTFDLTMSLAQVDTGVTTHKELKDVYKTIANVNLTDEEQIALRRQKLNTLKSKLRLECRPQAMPVQQWAHEMIADELIFETHNEDKDHIIRKPLSEISCKAERTRVLADLSEVREKLPDIHSVTAVTLAETSSEYESFVHASKVMIWSGHHTALKRELQQFNWKLSAMMEERIRKDALLTVRRPLTASQMLD